MLFTRLIDAILRAFGCSFLLELPGFHTDLLVIFVVFFFAASSVIAVDHLRAKVPSLRPFAAEALVLDSHLSLTAFFLTDYQSPRIPTVQRHINNAVLHPSLHFEYYFVNYTRENVSALHSLYPPDKYREMMKLTLRKEHRSADLLAKFFFSIGFFLENSTSRWFFRGIDDTVVNFGRLPVYLSQLEHRFDPEKDFVFKAQCVPCYPYFPQGGSGYLLSRAAARIMWPYGEYFMRTMVKPEDIAFGKFVGYFGQKMFDTTDEAFSGHYFGDENVAIVEKGLYGSLPRCPDPGGFKKVGCRPYVAPVRDIVFYHEWHGGGFLAFNRSRSIFSADPIFGWWTPWNSPLPKMCHFR
jgi:hypothetical protein